MVWFRKLSSLYFSLSNLILYSTQSLRKIITNTYNSSIMQWIFLLLLVSFDLFLVVVEDWRRSMIIVAITTTTYFRTSMTTSRFSSPGSRRTSSSTDQYAVYHHRPPIYSPHPPHILKSFFKTIFKPTIGSHTIFESSFYILNVLNRKISYLFLKIELVVRSYILMIVTMQRGSWWFILSFFIMLNNNIYNGYQY